MKPRNFPGAKNARRVGARDRAQIRLTKLNAQTNRDARLIKITEAEIARLNYIIIPEAYACAASSKKRRAGPSQIH